jgi:hypothetical protein
MGPPPVYDPLRETEYLSEAGLSEAERDGALRSTASTFDAASDRLVPGLARPGPRVLDFAPILVLEELPLARQVQALLRAAEQELDAPVEIEFALRLPERSGSPARLGFLQMRPLLSPRDEVDVTASDLGSEDLLLASHEALGNGRVEGVRDVVFVEPEAFEPRLTRAIARELERVNRGLLEQGRPYLLIGFGRWGSSDPSLGIPVRWDQIAGAKAIVEAALPGMSPDPSQGSHFFHNLSSFQVLYYTLRAGAAGLDWSVLRAQPLLASSGPLRHVRCRAPLLLKVDGRSRRGVVLVRRAEVEA